jgi:hypothetical protein
MAGGLTPAASDGPPTALADEIVVAGRPRSTTRRRSAWGALVAAVLLAHGCITVGVTDRLADLAADRDATNPPARIEVAYVREMALSTPPAAAPAAPPAATPRRAPPAAPVPAASAPEAPEAPEAPAVPPRAPEPAAAPPDAALADLAPAAAAPADLAASGVASSGSLPSAPSAETASATAMAASANAPARTAMGGALPSVALAAAAAGPADPASAPAGFAWPGSTRISYELTGNYRGPVNGTAQVEWIRVGTHYQVHLDLVVGPGLAPLITRRMSSDGEITAAGLVPRRYDQDTKVVLRDRHRATILFEPDSVVLAQGERRARVPGVQDTASQFVQLTYVFSTEPQRLTVGSVVQIPLALPHKVDVWTYDVVAEEVLSTPFGPLPCVHLKPRGLVARAGELRAEIWFAPQLRYLPARIRIDQDNDNYLDLIISRRPELGG